MPQIMSQPMPIEFVDERNAIVIRLEEYDTVRTIHMVDTAAPEPDDVRSRPLEGPLGR